MSAVVATSRDFSPGCGGDSGLDVNEFISTKASVASIDLDCDGHVDGLFTTYFNDRVSRPFSNNPACPQLNEQTYTLAFRRGEPGDHSYYAFGAAVRPIRGHFRRDPLRLRTVPLRLQLLGSGSQ